MTKTQHISAAILAQLAAGKSAKEAIDTVLGATNSRLGSVILAQILSRRAAAYERALELFEQKLKETIHTAQGDGQYPFGMDGDEGALYLSGKRDALQWVLDMLPASPDSAAVDGFSYDTRQSGDNSWR